MTSFKYNKQAYLTVHGGINKAVYAYPSEHYIFWKEEIKDFEYSWGTFGENRTTEGLFEDTVRIGDQFKIGSAKVMATQPRMSCYKLGMRFGRIDVIKKFLESGKSGIYFKVIKEGEIVINDTIKLIKKDNIDITINNIVYMVTKDEKENSELVEKAIQVPELPTRWKNYFVEKLSHLKK